MRVPPTWVRRPVSYFALYLLLVVTVVTSPLLVIAALILSHWLPGRWRALRLLGFAVVGLLTESAGVVVGGVLWIASGFGMALSSARFRRAHYRVLQWAVAVLVASACRLFSLTRTLDGASWDPADDGAHPADDGAHPSGNPILVLSRHAGPGDSILLMHLLMNGDHPRHPRVVLKDTMQLDPLCDLYLGRLPAKFVNPNPGSGDDMTSGIAELADGMGTDDALLIFPEGGNFTPKRRIRAIDRLRRAGHDEAAARAALLQHVLPPRPSGVLAALDGAPQADVVLIAHTGLDHMITVRDIWREIPERKRLRTRLTFNRRADVPESKDKRVTWLNDHWSETDRWIEAHRE